MGSKTITINCKVDEEFESWLGSQLIASGLTVSEFIRISIKVAAPIIRAHPAIIQMIRTEEVCGQ